MSLPQSQELDSKRPAGPASSNTMLFTLLIHVLYLQSLQVPGQKSDFEKHFRGLSRLAASWW